MLIESNKPQRIDGSVNNWWKQAISLVHFVWSIVQIPESIYGDLYTIWLTDRGKSRLPRNQPDFFCLTLQIERIYIIWTISLEKCQRSSLMLCKMQCKMLYTFL